ncbi:MAG: alcohol dehydrogenase catalytic domain-containing protein, partial [Clostridia bacterium]
MRALYGRHGFETALREMDNKCINGSLVRLRVIACGVCGTDLHFLRDAADFTPLGHEISAEVIEVGDAVTRVTLGDLVICEDVTLCGACDACKRGETRLCRSGLTLSGQPGMSDQLIVHENMLNRFTGIDPVVAAMTEPLAVAMRGVNKLSLKRFDDLVIFGLGAIGLFSCAYARSLGAGRIVMVARSPESLRNQAAEQAARDLGASEVLYTQNPDFFSHAQAFGPFAAAVVAAPPALCAPALSLVGYGGRVLAMGITLAAGQATPIDINDMIMNKKTLLTSLAEPASGFPEAIQMIASGAIDAGRVITHRVPLS